jgi:hypothetical protein
MLALLDGRQLDDQVGAAARLLASVLGQDIVIDGGVFRIACKVATDRVISTVDPDARHGHKTQARGFDGDKGHIALDPDSEIITATTATPATAVTPRLPTTCCPTSCPPKPKPRSMGMPPTARVSCWHAWIKPTSTMG